MNLSLSFRTPALVLFLAAAATASAHISYNGRNFGTFGQGGTVTISGQTIAGNYAWADGTDEDWGTSEYVRAFRFTLTYDTSITLSVAATTVGSAGTLLGDLTPGFSIYGGFAHLPPAKLDYDGPADSTTHISAQWRNASGGVTKEGNFRALADWKVGNDDGLTEADLSSFTFKGYAVDGTSANFGNAPGIVGDGLADGQVTGTFNLLAGDYTVFVGGADYLGQGEVGRGANVTLFVVPEPAAAGLSLAALAGLLLRRRRIS